MLPALARVRCGLPACTGQPAAMPEHHRHWVPRRCSGTMNCVHAANEIGAGVGITRRRAAGV